VKADVELGIRERRRSIRRQESRRRLIAAAVLVLLVHLVGAPALLLSIPMASPRPAEPEVALVRVPSAQWDAARAAAGEKPPPSPQQPPATPPPPPEPPPPPKQQPGQVVETAPGNEERPPDDTGLVAESNNRVKKQTIAKDRTAGQKVTMPQASSAAPPSESTKPPSPAPLALGGDPGERSKLPSEVQPRAEIPRVKEQQKLALKQEPGADEFRNRRESEEVDGNSDRLRLQGGEGEGETRGGNDGRPGSRELTTLVPSTGVLEKITGGPAPDHVDGVDEGSATFLNTREWRFASFFNRVKSTVAAQWNPSDVVRRRDPSGDMFLWKDRYTLLTVRLEDDGRLADVWIERSSGVDFLDEEAVAAFQKAQPFPNPPRGLADENGEIRFTFGFYLETSHPTFQIFRH
jgi:TonB family protein